MVFLRSLLAGLEEIDPDQSGRFSRLHHAAPFLATGVMERTLLRPRPRRGRLLCGPFILTFDGRFRGRRSFWRRGGACVRRGFRWCDRRLPQLGRARNGLGLSERLRRDRHDRRHDRKTQHARACARAHAAKGAAIANSHEVMIDCAVQLRIPFRHARKPVKGAQFACGPCLSGRAARVKTRRVFWQRSHGRKCAKELRQKVPSLVRGARTTSGFAMPTTERSVPDQPVHSRSQQETTWAPAASLFSQAQSLCYP